MYEVRSALQCNFTIHNTYTEYFLNRNQKGDYKMTKKIMSMILSIALVLSIAVVGISGTYAAEVSDKTSEVGAGNNIYFNVKKSGWSNVKTVYCHIWRADGTGEWPMWQSRAEKCLYDSSTGIATYDLSKTGNKISSSDGKVYCVIFSANTGMQTYNAIMSGKCIGDTLYCTGNKLENPEDSEKTANEAVWTKNTDCGPEKKITSSGNVIGTTLPEGDTDASMLACFLVAYYDWPERMDKVPALVKELNLSTSDVMKAVNKKLDNGGYDNADSIRASVKAVLDKIDVATPSISKLENIAGGIKLSWNKVSGTYGYRLYRKTSSGWKRFKDTTATSFTDSAVSVNQTKTYTIRCIDKNGKTISGYNSKGWSKKYTPVAPTISKLENTTGGVKLSWNKITGVYGYRVYAKTSSGWKKLKDTTATSLTDSAVTANKTKTYTIRCIDKKGKTISGYNSKGWSKKYTPVAPIISKLENTTSGIKLSWNKITGVYGYRVYQKTSNGWKRIKDTTATSFTDSAVSVNQTKTYTIRCIDKKGNTISGFNSKGWLKKYTAATPKITKLKNTSKGVSVTWNKVTGVYGYRLYRKYAGGSWTKVKDTTSTSFTDSGAKKGKKVTYTVRCIDKKGNTVSDYNKTGWSITRK
jgi:fibronectin type 3 domain-containing protein